MTLRFLEDKRTLVWAWLLFPLGPALAFARPTLLPWLSPLLLYCSYLSGVLSHNHNHCPVFVGRTSNLLYGAWLSFFYGFPSFAWVPSHNRNHHRHLNGAADASSTARHARRDTLWALLTYPVVCSRHQLPLVWAYAAQQLRTGSPRALHIVLETAALVVGHAGLLWLATELHGWSLGAFVYGFGVGVPSLLGNYWMMLTNYLQHVGCDPSSNHAHSRNFVHPLWNWFVFDNGYHTVHHQHPGLHWSRCRAAHRLSERRVEPELNQGTIFGYVLSRYLLARAPARLRS